MSRDMDQLGALRAYIVRHPELASSDARCVFAQIGDASPWLFFLDGDDPDELFAVAEDRLIVAGTRGSLSLFDVGARRRLATWQVRMPIPGRYLLSRDRSQLLSLLKPCPLIDTATLSVIRDFDIGGDATEAAEAVDGRFFLLRRDWSGTPPTPALLASASPDEPLSVQELPVQMFPGAAPPEDRLRADFRHLSPCGRWLLRFHSGSVSMRGALPTPGAEGGRGLLGRLFGKSSVERVLPASAAAARVDVVLELWRTRPLGFVRRLIVGEVDLATVAGLRPNEIDPNPPAGTTSPTVEALVVLSEASRARDFDDWTPDSPPLPAHLERQAEYRWIWRISEAIGTIAWSEDGEALRVRLGAAAAHTLRLDGGPVSDARWLETTFRPIPDAVKKRALEFIKDARCVTIAAPGTDPARLEAAIDALAIKIRRDFATIFRRSRVRVRFALPDRKCDEPEFFELVQSHPQLRSAMRRLWQAFSDGSSDNWQLEARYDESTAFFAHGALAYARLDPEAWRLLDLWFERKPDHDCYGPDKVLPAISDVNGWADRDVIEWGLRALWR